jgi:tripartite-type tricarboxylate transporter receptor subunit TctC
VKIQLIEERSMRMRRLRFGAGCVAAIVMGASPSAHAQDYPTKPVTFITPAAAGNSPDVVTRVVADRLTQMWKQQIVVLNRPGAGGLIAAQAAAAVEKDGYSLYVAQASTFTVLPIEQEGKMPVNLQTAFVPIGMVGEQPIALSVNKDVPVSNVADLIALANKTPDGMLFGATNRGGQSHLTGELFRERAKANISFVHAAGASVSLNDVIAGRIPIMFEGLAGLAPGIQGGGIKLLGVASRERLPNLSSSGSWHCSTFRQRQGRSAPSERHAMDRPLRRWSRVAPARRCNGPDRSPVSTNWPDRSRRLRSRSCQRCRRCPLTRESDHGKWPRRSRSTVLRRRRCDQPDRCLASTNWLCT